MNKTNILINSCEMVIQEKHHVMCIYLNKIVYLYYQHPYCILKLADGKDVILHCTLSSIEGQLPDVFFRCGRSLVVNLSYVKTVSRKMQFLSVGYGKHEERHAVSRRRVQELSDRLLEVKTCIPRCSQCHTCSMATTCRVCV